ncbi:hypothetical protein BU17DRAFT_69021 [Hysterangium stoloniferum]|nr:hypothetical protein BU17DRAFT_69021 [Hysterangium stoloniferum]
MSDESFIPEWFYELNSDGAAFLNFPHFNEGFSDYGFPVSPRGEGNVVRGGVHEPLMAGTPFFNANDGSEESTSLISPQSWDGPDRDLWQYVRQGDPHATSPVNPSPDVGAVVSPPQGLSPSHGQQRDPGAGQLHKIESRVSHEAELIDSWIIRTRVTGNRGRGVKYKWDCAACDAPPFSSKENARVHVRSKHFLDEQPFKCLHPECSAKNTGFASLSSARRHVKDKAKAWCPHCGKELGRKNYVSKRHKQHCKGRKHLAKPGLVAGA